MKNPVGRGELDLGVLELLYCRGRHLLATISSTFVIWVAWERAQCRAPACHHWVTAPTVARSRFSGYLWAPLRES